MKTRDEEEQAMAVDRIIVAETVDLDPPPLSTPPPPSSPSPSHSPPLGGDESPRPGELEAIRSSVQKKKKRVSKPSPRRTRAAATAEAAAAEATEAANNNKRKRQQPSSPSLPLPLLAPPATPLQDKKKKKKKDKKKANKPAPIPFDARPFLAAEREKNTSFDPRLPAPGWMPPPSPLSLIEEALFSRPWRLLVACCLLNKTSAGVARPCVREFFRRYPDAEAAAAIKQEGEGESGGEELEEVATLFRPCGCHRKRAAAVVRLSREFLQTNWRDPRELFGVGEYASDAYWIFVRGIWHCGAEGEEKEGEGEERKKKDDSSGGSDNNNGSKKTKMKTYSSSPRSPSFSWRPKDKDLAKYVDFLVETGGQGCGLEREEF